MTDFAQFTGYIRCKKCNGAGKWSFKDLFLSFGIMGGILLGDAQDNDRFTIGEMQLCDGSSPRWISDAEERFLVRLREGGRDGFLWDRLGNLYYKGGRPELAAVAFEQSVRVDPAQVESHYSLGNILFQIDEDELAAYHYRMMLVHAGTYRRLDAVQLRDMLAAGLQELFEIHNRTGHTIPFLPGPNCPNYLEQVKSLRQVRMVFHD